MQEPISKTMRDRCSDLVKEIGDMKNAAKQLGENPLAEDLRQAELMMIKASAYCAMWVQLDEG